LKKDVEKMEATERAPTDRANAAVPAGTAISWGRRALRRKDCCKTQ
jgi:hypothetical protein